MDAVWCRRGLHFVPHADMDNGAGGLFAQCRRCRSYQAHSNRRALMAARRAAIELHTPCVQCGEARLCALDHAHHSRALKHVRISRCRRPSAVLAEHDVVRSLCVGCHARETFAEAPRGSMRRAQRHGVVRREALVARHLQERYAGRCQFFGCAFAVAAHDPPAHRRVLEWDHQGAAPKAMSISDLVWRGPDDALQAELRLCVPLCRPHHRVVTRYRRAVDAAHTVDRARPLPPEWMAAADATVQNPDAWIAVVCGSRISAGTTAAPPLPPCPPAPPAAPATAE